MSAQVEPIILDTSYKLELAAGKASAAEARLVLVRACILAAESFIVSAHRSSPVRGKQLIAAPSGLDSHHACCCVMLLCNNVMKFCTAVHQQ